MIYMLSWRWGREEVHQDWPQTGLPWDGGGGRVTRVLNDQHTQGIVPIQSPGIWDILSPSHLAEIIGSNLEGIEETGCILDDVIITGKDDEEQPNHLEEVLKSLKEHGLRANRDKWVFFLRKITYCGHAVDKHGLARLKKRSTQSLMSQGQRTSNKSVHC